MRTSRRFAGTISLAALTALASVHCGAPSSDGGESVQQSGQALSNIAQVVDNDFQGMYAEMQTQYRTCVSKGSCPAKTFPSTSACVEVAKLTPGNNPWVNPIVFYGGAVSGSLIQVGAQLGADWVFDVHHAQAAAFWYRAAGVSVAFDVSAGAYDGLAFTSASNVLDAWSGDFISGSAGFSLFGLVGAAGTGFGSPQTPPVTFGLSVGVSIGTPTDPLPVNVSVEPGTWWAWDSATDNMEKALWFAPLGQSIQHQGGHDYVQFGSPGQTAAAATIYGGPALGVLAVASLAATAFSNQNVTYQKVCTPTPSTPTSCGVLTTGQGLLENEEVGSCNGKYTLIQQTDGNLVLYETSGKALWSSRTGGKPGYASVLQADGNFVTYTDGNAPLWASGTNGNGGDRVAIQNDGNVVIYSSSGRALWATNTAQRTPPPAPPAGKLVGCNGAGQVMESDAVIPYCDDSGGSSEYQCDQYANRAMSALDLPPVDNWAANLACEICDLVANDPNLSRLYSVWGPGYRQTAGHAPPSANDLLIWTETTGCDEANKWSPGHVAVVASSDRNYVQYVQQNWMVAQSVSGSAYGGLVRSTTSWDGGSSFFGNPGNPDGSPNPTYLPKCWVHPECPRGTSCNPGHHNPCTGVTHANNGQYCGTSTQAGFNSALADHGTVYECFDGQIADELRCPGGCDVAGAGHADGCKDPCLDVPASENGLYCGTATAFGFNSRDANPGWLYTCNGGRSVAASTANCGGHGCTVNATGADSCTPHPSTDPCASVPAANNGTYCAGSPQFHFDPSHIATPGAVYTCENGVTRREALCGAFGCNVNSSGPDACEPTSDPCENVPAYENGTFCGLSNEWGFRPGVADHQTLYTCENGHIVQSSPCGAGCYVNPLGSDGCN